MADYVEGTIVAVVALAVLVAVFLRPKIINNFVKVVVSSFGIEEFNKGKHSARPLFIKILFLILIITFLFAFQKELRDLIGSRL